MSCWLPQLSPMIEFNPHAAGSPDPTGSPCAVEFFRKGVRMGRPRKAQTCPTCGDSGWAIQQLPEGRQHAVRCECRTGNWSERLIAAASVPKRYEHCTFSNFDADFQGANPSLATARFLAGRFVEDYPVETVGLLLIGQSGLGKTHLAVGVIKD